VKGGFGAPKTILKSSPESDVKIAESAQWRKFWSVRVEPCEALPGKRKTRPKGRV
jgi:hypothetical protein